MNEQEQWDKAIEIANAAIQDVDFMSVSEILEDAELDDVVVNDIYEKVGKTRANGDEYHTMQEMYRYRALYNAGLFSAWAKSGEVPVYKSLKHSDGEACFGGSMFIVVAELPTGQISNHYENQYWGAFDIPEVELPPEYDGHTPKVAADRLESYLLGEG